MSHILCLDGGSSSLKFAAYRVSGGSELVAAGGGTLPAGSDARAALANALSSLEPPVAAGIEAVGHRIVFGGSRYIDPIVATADVLEDLERFVSIEPLHLRPELDLLYAALERFPRPPHVCCFDTAFHQCNPSIAKRLPLPRGLDPTIRRYGFHGLSYEYIASQLGSGSGRTVVAHLGSGASLCAMRDGAPLDTTMGFSALGGLMMGTRPGDLDPGIALRLLGSDGYDLAKLTDLFYRRSGLYGVSGSSSDCQTLIAASAHDVAARDAIELFVYQLVKHLGSMIAVLGGLDTLVFTAGIGENAPSVRSSACQAFEFLGLQLDRAANEANARTISAPASSVTVLVIPTDENLVMAGHALALLRKVS